MHLVMNPSPLTPRHSLEGMAASCLAVAAAAKKTLVPAFSSIPGSLERHSCQSCRAVAVEPQVYPAFSPADFPATQAAAFKAAELAEAALRQHANDKV